MGRRWVGNGLAARQCCRPKFLKGAAVENHKLWSWVADCHSDRPLSGYGEVATLLIPHIPLDRLRFHLRPIDSSVLVCRHPFRIAGRPESRCRIRNERRHRSVLRAADPDAALPARVMTIPVAIGRFRIGHVNRIVPIDIDPARPAELFPFLQKLAILVEDLYAIVGAIADEQASARIECQCMRSIKVARCGSLLAPSLDELAVLVELDDARIRFAAMSVGHEDVAVGSHYDVGRLIEFVRAIASHACLSERQQDLAGRRKLENLMTFAIPTLAIRDPDIALLIDEHAVRKNEPALAK